MLNDTPTQAGSFDDVPCASRREAFLADASDRLVDEQFAGPIPALLPSTTWTTRGGSRSFSHLCNPPCSACCLMHSTLSQCSCQENIACAMLRACSYLPSERLGHNRHNQRQRTASGAVEARTLVTAKVAVRSSGLLLR